MDLFKLPLRQPRMAACPDCGRMVSRRARNCPGCGGPIRMGVLAGIGKLFKWWLLACLLVLGLAQFVRFLMLLASRL